MTPTVISPVIWKKKPPIMMNGSSCDAYIVIGTSAMRALSGPYARACWMAWPHSCAEMPSAATEGV